jgi:tetratricopeptide (TPR) repeat protein
MFNVKMLRRSSPLLFLTVALLALVLAAPAGAQDNGPAAASRAQADAFLLQADSALETGDLARAGTLTASALELSPDYSEALYLAARVESADRPSTRAAIDHLRAALRAASWSRTDPLPASQLLTGLLIRTGQLAEARKAADRLVSTRPEDPENFILLARQMDKAGSAAAELRTLTDAVNRFPEQDELRLMTARLLARLGRSAEAASIVRVGLRVHPESLPLLLASGGLEIDRIARTTSLDLYLSKGGTDPLAAVLGMESVPIGQRRRYLDAFLSLGGLSRQDLVGRAQDAVKSSRDSAAALGKALAAYSGTRDLDSDGDGYWDERWTFADGKVTRWVREPAEDGVAQYEAVFQDGKAVSLDTRSPDGAVTRFRYSRYPSLESVALPGEGTWFVVPYTLALPFLRDGIVSADGSAPRIVARPPAPSADAVRRGSFRVEEYGPDGVTLVRRVDLSRGQRVYMEESLAGDGIIDHRLWYRDGQPDRGSRSLAHDGEFPVVETWKNGKLASEAVDTNGSGTPDYHETFGGTAVRSWDYNEDGRDDARELALPDGSRVREISTRMDGVFDVRIVTRGGRIVSLQRGGTPVAVARDDSRGVTWIGAPAGAPGKPDPTARDGIQVISGSPYLVFRLEGTLYAEALQK